MGLQKYNELVLLVHPLFDVFFPQGSSVSDDKLDLYKHKFDWNKFKYAYPTSKQKDIDGIVKDLPILDSKKRIQIKKSLGVYGKTINEYAKRDDVLLVVFVPYKVHFDIHENQELYLKLLSKFLRHSKSIFGDRLLVSDFDPKFMSGTSIFSKALHKNDAIYSMFSEKLRITSFGEYSGENCCIPWWTEAVLKSIKERTNIKPEVKVLYDKSIDKNYKIHDKEGFRQRYLFGKDKKDYFKKNKISRNSKKKTFNFKRTPKIK